MQTQNYKLDFTGQNTICNNTGDFGDGGGINGINFQNWETLTK